MFSIVIRLCIIAVLHICSPHINTTCSLLSVTHMKLLAGLTLASEDSGSLAKLEPVNKQIYL